MLKTIHVAAPVERVFGFWTDYQNFPRFMHNVREVLQVAENRSHWVVAGPAGVPVQWTAEITRVVPGEIIEWRSVSDSDVRHEGSVTFETNGDSGTRVSVRLSYVPPAGAFGHAVASIFGADPKSEMDADLLRMKSMIETGHPPHDAARPPLPSEKAKPFSLGGGLRGRRAGAHQLAQHEGQDAAVAVVVDLDRGVDAAFHRDLHLAAVACR